MLGGVVGCSRFAAFKNKYRAWIVLSFYGEAIPHVGVRRVSFLRALGVSSSSFEFEPNLAVEKHNAGRNYTFGKCLSYLTQT